MIKNDKKIRCIPSSLDTSCDRDVKMTNFYSANYVLAVVVLCLVIATSTCQELSGNLTGVYQDEEATTNSFGEYTFETESYSRADDINYQARVLNGSYCQRAYACQPLSATSRETVIRRCSCHDYCSIFGDCCSDKVSTFPPSELQNVPRMSFTCAPKAFLKHSVYVITSCPASYTDRSIADNCSAFANFSATTFDVRWTPVTDIITGATFRNIFCAACWGKTRRDVAAWLWRVSCPKAPDEIDQPQTDSDNSSSAASTNDSARYTRRSAADYVRSSCSLTFEPPSMNASLQSCEEEVIADCGISSSTGGFDENLLSACQSGPARYVYDERGKIYWNAECAKCRLWPIVPTLTCQQSAIVARFVPPSFSLSIILTPDSDFCAAAAGSLSSSDGWTPQALCQGLRSCSESGGSGWATGCQSKPQTRRIIEVNAVKDVTASANESTSSCSFTDVQLSSAAAAKALNATWLFISDEEGTLAVMLNENATVCLRCAIKRYDNFTVLNRSLVVVSFSVSVQSQTIDYPMYTVEGGVAIVCAAFLSSSERASPGDGGCTALPAYVSALFLCLSEASLLIFFAAYARVRALRRFPGEMVLNESVAFFLAFLLFLFRPLVGSLPAACTALAVLIHYFLLAAFAWTALHSAEIARALRFRVSSGASTCRRATYYCFAWGAPLACVALGLGADASAFEFRPLYGPPQCFIGSRLGNLTLFMAPLCIFLTIDLSAYIFMIIKLAVIARQTRSVRSSHREKLWLSAKLVFSMGLLWIFAVLASFTQSSALYCAFSLVNALQGAFVFAVFVCKRDVFVSLGRETKARTKTSALPSSNARSTTSSVSLQ